MNEIPSNQEQNKARGRGIKYEMIVAIAAIFIGVISLFVYMYQAHIMREQQHASVWPYIEWTLSISSTGGMKISVFNKGVGPAIIQSTLLKLDGKPVGTWLGLVNGILGRSDSLAYAITDIDNTVMAPGEQIDPVVVGDSPATRRLDPSLYPRITFEICYCSIYGDCWTSKGKRVVESECQ